MQCIFLTTVPDADRASRGLHQNVVGFLLKATEPLTRSPRGAPPTKIVADVAVGGAPRGDSFLLIEATSIAAPAQSSAGGSHRGHAPAVPVNGPGSGSPCYGQNHNRDSADAVQACTGPG